MRLTGSFLWVLLAGCASGPERAPASPSVQTAADQAARLLVGRFDNAVQATADPSYRAIQLSACRVTAPELGSVVLYLEQAQLDEVHAPYRQRLYVVEARVPVATHAVYRVFELKAPAAAVGLCTRAAAPVLGSVDAEEKPGCAVHLVWDGKRFTGGTSGTGCASTLRGATYTTSDVILEAAELQTWDRGFDAAGKQVWGVDKGPYIFLRRTPLP